MFLRSELQFENGTCRLFAADAAMNEVNGFHVYTARKAVL
jgi:hypothetical protein